MGTVIILESAAWQASSDWATPLGLSQQELAELNGQAINMLLRLKNEYEKSISDVIVSGCIGPRGDVAEFATSHSQLRTRFPHINILDGCCGTDLTHVTAIAEACLVEC